MPEKLKAVTLGQWLQVISTVVVLATVLFSWRDGKTRDRLVLEALAVKVTETKLAVDEHVSKSDARHSALQAIVNDHEKRVWFLERKAP